MKNINNIYETLLFNDAKLNILWFSDIHYIVDKKLPFFENFKNSFLEKSKEINLDSPIDYVIISGDLAQSGKTEEYEALFNDFIKPLFEIIQNAKLLIIPGNHDLTYDYLEIYNYIETKNKNEFIRKTDRDKIFKNYTEFFREKLSFFPINISNTYKGSFYNGYLKDDDKKIIFVLLNSAWLSYSIKIIDYYLREVIDPNKLKDEIERLSYANDIYYKTLEYGEQLLALKETFKDLDVLKTYIEKNPDYIVVNVKHHPENWLNWHERLDYKDNEYLNLNKISHIFLDSHEHVRKEWKPYQNKQQQVYLKSGAFIELDYSNNKNVIRKKKLENSLFHIISINSTRKKIKLKNFSYNPKKNNWLEYIENSNLVYRLQNDIIPPLEENYRISILDKIKENLKKSKFEFINKLFKNYKCDNVKGYAINGSDLIIFQKDIKFDFYYYSFIKNNTIKNIYFICLDLLIDDKKNFYGTKNDKIEDRDKAIGKIKKYLEAEFNEYRVNFFTKNEYTDKSYINDFKELTLNLVLLPYWKYQNIL